MTFLLANEKKDTTCMIQIQNKERSDGYISKKLDIGYESEERYSDGRNSKGEISGGGNS